MSVCVRAHVGANVCEWGGVGSPSTALVPLVLPASFLLAYQHALLIGLLHLILFTARTVPLTVLALLCVSWMLWTS